MKDLLSIAIEAFRKYHDFAMGAEEYYWIILIGKFSGFPY